MMFAVVVGVGIRLLIVLKTLREEIGAQRRRGDYLRDYQSAVISQLWRQLVVMQHNVRVVL